jgi:hypothetical protein
MLTACLSVNVQAHRPVTSSVVVELRGGFNKNVKKAPVVKAKATANNHHHEEHLMSAPVAIANVLADLCPHGMLPIGMLRLYYFMVELTFLYTILKRLSFS